MNSPEQKEGNGQEKVTLLSMFKSVASSFFGVQSSKNRKRDFSRGKMSHFIVIGIVMTVAFIFLVLLAVKLALKSSGM